MVIVILNTMNRDFTVAIFLLIIGIFGIVTITRLVYYYKKLSRLLEQYPEEKSKCTISDENKHKFIFSADFFENKELEYLRIKVRESLRWVFFFIISFIIFFLII